MLDYVWGHPAEVLLGAMTRREFAAITSETRYVQVGDGAGKSISLPAAVLRSAPIMIMVTAGVPPAEVLLEALQQVLARGANGELDIETQRIPLAGIEAAWEQDQQGKRFVVIP